MNPTPRKPKVGEVMTCLNGETFEPAPGGGGGGFAPASRYKAGGADPIALDTLAAPTDVTTLNATTTEHGLLPKLSNVAEEFMNGVGGWAVPGGATKAIIRYQSGNNDSVPAAVASIVDFGTIDFATVGGLVTTGAAWKFTAATAGKYFVTAAVGLDSFTWAALDQMQLLLYKNGGLASILAYKVFQATVTSYEMVTGSDFISLGVGDYIDVEIYQYNGGFTAIDLNGSVAQRTYISIEQK